MRRKLLVAALAVLGGCDHHHGIGALGSDAGGATSGQEAGGFLVDGGVGGAVGNGGMLQAAGGSGGCGILCLIPIGGSGSGGNTAGFPIIDAGVGTGYGWDAGGGTPIPQGGVDAQSVFPRQDAGGGTPPRNDAGPAATGPLSQGPTSWTGYIENYQFPSGSDVIRFTSTVDASGQVMVTVFLGDGPPPPPATDPRVGYPPALRTLAMNDMMPLDAYYWAEGFAYSMASGTFSGQRLRFTIKNFQLWSGWCALQKPVDDSGMCLPESWPAASCDESHQCSLMNYATGQVIQVDLAAFNLCLSYRVCACSTTACDSDPNSGTTASFDVAVTGSAADGSVIGLIGDRANVHFTLDGS